MTESTHQAVRFEDRVSGVADATRREVAALAGGATEMVQRHPVAILMLGFGLGFGLGLGLTSLWPARNPSWAERHLPGSLSDLPRRAGWPRLGSSIHDAGETAHNALQELAGSLRDLPAAIAPWLPGH